VLIVVVVVVVVVQDLRAETDAHGTQRVATPRRRDDERPAPRNTHGANEINQHRLDLRDDAADAR